MIADYTYAASLQHRHEALFLPSDADDICPVEARQWDEALVASTQAAQLVVLPRLLAAQIERANAPGLSVRRRAYRSRLAEQTRRDIARLEAKLAEWGT